MSVALPVGGSASGNPPTPSVGPAIDALLEQALRCILRQSLRELDVMVILNGADPQLHALVRTFAFHDSRIRLLELPRPNLAAALNAGLKSARFDLVARMDADDLCHPERLERQAAFMVSHPRIAALGCAWELIAPDGEGGDRTITVVRPPTEPEDLRWRLLLGNWLAHGSMMLRRKAVLAAGGYDTKCERSQDFELWLRLAGLSGPVSAGAKQGIRTRTRAGGTSAARLGPSRIACLPDVLYQYRTRYPGDPGRSTPQQSEVAAPVMLAAWERLSNLAARDRRRLTEALAAAISREGGPSGSMTGVEELLALRPSKEALLAWLWAQWHHPPMPRRAAEVCRVSRLREVCAELRGRGAGGIWLWGAGDHTRWVLEHRDEVGLPIRGIVDDHASGERFGFAIRRPERLKKGDWVLISSDWYEEDIWKAATAQRKRGVHVQRLYG